MDCCQCQGIEATFGKRVAARELGRYQRKGPARTARLLLEALNHALSEAAGAEGVQGMTLLDIGGGVGAIHHSLLSSGAASATCVDASSAYLAAAQEESERQGHADRVVYHHGDFVALAPGLAPADIVTLDRVICCYHDMEALVGLSSALAGRLYGVVYPRDAWWVKAAWKLADPFWRLWASVRHNPFRAYLHAPQAVDSLVRSKGLEQCFFRTAGIWQVVVYRRTRPAA